MFVQIEAPAGSLLTFHILPLSPRALQSPSAVEILQHLRTSPHMKTSKRLLLRMTISISLLVAAVGKFIEERVQ